MSTIHPHSLIDHLGCLLAPSSIAIVGASADSTRFAGRTLKHLIAHGYTGEIYPVNPKRDEIAGLRCYRNVGALPHAVDTVFIQVGAEATVGVLEDCARQGVKSAILHAAGLGETGAEGSAQRARVMDIATSGGMAVLGPNCAGIANIAQNTILSPIACYDVPHLTKGRIALVSQSGGLTGAYVSRAEARGIGFSCIVSTGNEMLLDVSHFVRHFARDPGTDVIALFIETLRDVAAFRRAAAEALETSKPIVVLKIGRTEAGARAASSHTGALTGSDAVYDAVFRQTGVTRVETLEDLLEVSAMFRKIVLPRGNRVGVVTTTGGGAALVVEAAAAQGVDFPMPQSDSIDEGDDRLPDFVVRSNPLDVTMSGVGDSYRRELVRMLDDDAFDIVVGVIGTSGQFNPEVAVLPLVEASEHARKPLVAFCTAQADQALRLFEKKGIPSFRTPDGCGRALGYLVRLGGFVHRSHARQSETRVVFPLEQIRCMLRGAPRILDEHQSKCLLAECGIPIIREAVAGDGDAALAVAQTIGYPVALKVLSADIPHKTEARALALNVRSPEQLRQCAGEVLENVRLFNPNARISGLLVQRMAHAGVEVIVGVSRDLQFGPVLMFGMGGVLAEVMKDVAFRALPIERVDAFEMISETKAAALLNGHRGSPPSDVEALVEVLMRVSQLAVDLDEELWELDINPLIVGARGSGVTVVDALVVRRGN